MEKTYIAIDLKSFYASVECVERGLDPLRTNLVVADIERTEKTICLAVSPSLKSFGVPGRPRLYEVIQRVEEINRKRLESCPEHRFWGESYDLRRLQEDPSLKLTYIAAKPQMAHYMQRSSEIYRIYLNYASADDIHVYSIDEVFIDATNYLYTTGMTAHEYTMAIIRDVLRTTGITATAGIGTNLYLCKVAMDIVAKHIAPDEDGVRIAQLDEMSYRRLLWNHRPLTDFWRVGKGYAKKLEENSLFTMGDIAKCSLGDPDSRYSEDLLYRLFGVNAELLIDHAWGWEPCTMQDIKSYKPQTNSLSSGQVLPTPYPAESARRVVSEMADALSLDLLDKGLVTDKIVLSVNYDRSNLSDPKIREHYSGETTKDWYGRTVPKHAHGSFNLKPPTSSSRQIIAAALSIFDRTVDPGLLIRNINIGAAGVVSEQDIGNIPQVEQLTLFDDSFEPSEEETASLEKERKTQQAILGIKKKFGKNAILKGTSFEEGATARQRNDQIGGHHA